jgi:hypothetical protein
MEYYMIKKRVNPWKLLDDNYTTVKVTTDNFVLSPNYKNVYYKFIPQVTEFWRRQDWKYEFDVYEVKFKILTDDGGKLDTSYLSAIIEGLEDVYFKLQTYYGNNSQIMTNAEKELYESQIDKYMYHIKKEHMKSTDLEDIIKSYQDCFFGIKTIDNLVVKAY